MLLMCRMTANSFFPCAPAQSLADEVRVAGEQARDCQQGADGATKEASPEDVARIEAQDDRLRQCSAAVADADRKLIDLHRP